MGKHMSSKLDLSNFDVHVQESFKSIQLLYKNQLHNQSKYLGFILIDQLAWLISGNEQQVNIYFKAWLDKYFIKYYPEITSEEIWASRNGMLHNGSSISRDIVKQKVSRQLLFVYNLNHFDEINKVFNDPSYAVVNSARFLEIALLEAVKEFRIDLEQGYVPDVDDVKVKLGKLLTDLKS